MSKYTPLRIFLAGVRESEIELSFSEIERMLGCRLPPSARDHHRPWWSNENGGSHVQARAWMDAGYQVWEVDLVRERTRFRRKGADSVDPARSSVREPSDPQSEDIIRVDRNALSAASRRLLADYCVESSHDEGAAVARAVHEAAKARRARLVSDAVAHAPKVTDDSVDLIREDRDAR